MATSAQSIASDTLLAPEQITTHIRPRVSVIIITYNHEQYITTAVEGVLAQQTSFPFEIIVSEDCSTDGTRSILTDLERNDPDHIKLLFSDHNLNTNYVIRRAFEVARGEYVAILDGDDFWTVVHKLQKQVDFLDRNPSFALCFHDLLKIYEDGDIAPHPFIQWPTPSVLTFDDVIRANLVPTASALVRRSAVDPLPPWYDRAEYGDWPLWILASLKGDLAYMDEIMGTYRAHSGGNWTSLNPRAQHKGCIRFFSQVERGLGSSYTKKLHSSRAARRRELIDYLDSEKHFWASIQQILYGLWADHFAYSTREKLELSRDIRRRVFARICSKRSR